MSNNQNTLKDTDHKVAEGAKQSTECGKEKAGTGGTCGAICDASAIKERMDVIASCGKKVGEVDHIEDATIKLTKNDSPDGKHHFIPTGWVDHVDTHVHLKKNSEETEKGWKSEAAACGA